jgi:hypothetical protein
MNNEMILIGYIECLLWSETDDNGEPFDSNYNKDDISKEALSTITKSVNDFLNYADVKALVESVNMESGQIGHDFCLTRNGHGVGFWDRDLCDIGDKLTEYSEFFGNMHLYTGDDNKLHVC